MGRAVLLVVMWVVYKLTSEDGEMVHVSEIHEIRSNQEETYTRLVLYAQYAENQGYERVLIRSSDSDVFFILLYFAHQLNTTLLLDTGSGMRRRIMNISTLAEDIDPEYASSILGLYVFTGEDANCAFKGKGKVNPLKKVEKMPKFQKSFAVLGNDWHLTDELIKDLEQFTCAMAS